MTPRVPMWECSPKWASGMSSSTTTYIIDPAAKASSQGIRGWMLPATSTASTPKMGSTMPERLPYKKLFQAGRPSRRRGRAMAAPSGKFWMPMPNARATAPA